MVRRLIPMKGEEFIKKVLDGERDFSGINLEKGFDLSGSEGYGEMHSYLRQQDLEKTPMIIEGSEFEYVIATGIYLPYVKGEGVNFYRADLKDANCHGSNIPDGNFEGADLRYANFYGSNLPWGNFERADLWGINLKDTDLGHTYFGGAFLLGADLGEAYLHGANFELANLQGANLERANFCKVNLKNTNLKYTNLRDVKNLEKTINLETAIFYRTKVTEKEKKIIEEASKGIERFVVE